MDVRWLGHATVLVDLGGVRVLTDPVLRDRIGPIRRYAATVRPEEYADVDLVLISHLHPDHLHLRSLELLPSSVPVVGPVGTARLLRRAGRTVQELRPGESTTAAGLTVTATPAVHDGRRVPLPPWRPGTSAVGLILGGVYFAGDTELFAEMAELCGRVDVALLPVGGWGPNLGRGHMDAAQAAQAVELIRPRTAVPVHWGTLRLPGPRPLQPVSFRTMGARFAADVAAGASATVVHVLAVGEGIKL